MLIMKLLRILLAPMLASLLCGQVQNELFDKAPPHVDEALRARISLFYQAHVDGKFRLADTVVHEDSKDAFFVAQKDQHKGFEIIRINYSENFTKARAVVAVRTDFVMPMFGKQEVTIPLTTLWKIDNGEWWWYIRPREEGLETPFGIMKPGPDTPAGNTQANVIRLPTASDILNQVKVNKTKVVLSSYKHTTDEVIIINGMPGPIQLDFTIGSFQGFEAKLDRKELNANEETKIIFSCDPVDKEPKRELQGILRISPTNHVIPIQVVFTIAPELLEQLPDEHPLRRSMNEHETETQPSEK